MIEEDKVFIDKRLLKHGIDYEIDTYKMLSDRGLDSATVSVGGIIRCRDRYLDVGGLITSGDIKMEDTIRVGKNNTTKCCAITTAYNALYRTMVEKLNIEIVNDTVSQPMMVYDPRDSDKVQIVFIIDVVKTWGRFGDFKFESIYDIVLKNNFDSSIAAELVSEDFILYR